MPNHSAKVPLLLCRPVLPPQHARGEGTRTVAKHTQSAAELRCLPLVLDAIRHLQSWHRPRAVWTANGVSLTRCAWPWRACPWAPACLHASFLRHAAPLHR